MSRLNLCWLSELNMFYNPTAESAEILSLHLSESHTMTKFKSQQLIFVAGEGIEGDAHRGQYVQHRSRWKLNRKAPNLRQVHLIHSELFDELRSKGFSVGPGEMGENVTTRGLDVLRLPRNAIIHLGSQVSLQITGLRNPCKQLNALQDGLMKAVLDRDEDDNLIRKAGVMAVVLSSGTVNSNDKIVVELPPKPLEALTPV